MPKPDATAFARRLRREMTPPECRMWVLLRNRACGHKFRRQVPRGPYTLDFVCLARRLVIEIDGQQHHVSETDRARDAWLHAHGFRVRRVGNRMVMKELQAVWDAIEVALAAEGPPETTWLL